MASPLPNTRRARRRPMADINVVPYIDVMLVLLVIFMVTAPMLHQGVEVELPQTSAEPLQDQQQDPVIVTVDADGNYSLSVGAKPGEAIDADQLMVTVAALLRQQPQTPILVRGDTNVPYGRVVDVMARLQAAGAPKVGLLTQPAD